MNSNILVARKQRELTQEQLASAVGVNQADIVRIEKHGWIPPADVRQRLSQALGVGEQDLFDLTANGARTRP